jgi:hypothetical protein
MVYRWALLLSLMQRALYPTGVLTNQTLQRFPYRSYPGFVIAWPPFWKTESWRHTLTRKGGAAVGTALPASHRLGCRARIFGEMEPMSRADDYPTMKRLHLKRMQQLEFMMALAIVTVLAGLMYYGRLVWLLFSPD